LARKILLADDSVTAQNMGRKILADAGYEVFTVNNGSAALKKIAEAKPELIVLDVYMPGYSGLEVCQRLKETQETSRIPILLTVGKLEPFKPEEAKRVRADAFIVKPFEASELLSALSKLEDKIVPAGRETSKSGRFARANAAIEEGRYDKTMAIEEDSGWKNRIAFPSKKKKKAEEEEDGNDPAIYNALNKDLRTVVEHPAAATAHGTNDERVNVEALAPEGLPKDVTPEEIAALAAAAAQIQGTVAESKEPEAIPQPAQPFEPAAALPTPFNQSDIETVDLNLAAIKKAEAALAEPLAQALPAPEPHQPELAKEPEAVASTSITEVPEPKQEAERPVDVPAVAAQESASPVAPQGAELMAAFTSVEPQNISTASSGNGLGSQEAADEPITMAVAAGAEHVGIPSRWTAVSVPLASDEAGISLEHEMQKAHAAFAAAEAPPVPVATIAETPVPEASPLPEPPVEKAISEPEPPPAETPEASEVGTTVASIANDAISAVVKELEAAAAAFEGHRPFSSDTAPNPAPVVNTVQESSQEAEPEISAPVPAAQTEPMRLEPEETKPEAVITENASTEQPSAPTEEIASTEPPMAAPVEHPQTAAPESSFETPVSSRHDTEPLASDEPAAAGTPEVSKKESEIAETTAAAWASWRRIRESDRKSESSTSANDNDHPDAAMAVAAGAEKAPEEASAETESGDIANIVDSVLADLRPKIVEEISRKLGKKK
jgi:twitching motility two-component system response regulator PilH